MILWAFLAQAAVAGERPSPVATTAPVVVAPAAETKPIIADSQFDQALPKLDDDLNAPLSAIEPLADAPVAQGRVPATGPVPAGGQSATAVSGAPGGSAPGNPGVPVAAGAPAAQSSAADASALAQPLTPLASFDVEPVQVAAEPGETAPEIRYRVVVEGLKQAGLEGQFRSLSALDKGDGKGANGAVIAARAREDEALALRIARADGYYDAVASSLVEPVAGQTGRATATISVSLGERYKLGEIIVTGPATIPPNMPREILSLKTGDPIIASVIEGAEAGISLQLPQRGYPFVTVGQRDIALDDNQPVGDYTLSVDPGPRSSFGGFSTTGKLAFDAEHVGVLSRFKRGELYDNRRVDDLREAMVATGLFESVAVEPQRTGEIAPDGTEYVNLLVTQNAGPARRLAATAGYSTGQGIRIDGSWTHKNLFKKAR